MIAEVQEKVTQFRIGAQITLNIKTIESDKEEVEVETDTNHILVIDCSGSMYSEIPKIREHIKAKLPKLMKENDTLSIIWFSGKREFGTLIKAEKIATLKDLSDINKQLDRWLKPMGLTGFKEPIEEVGRLTKEIGNGHPFSLFFLSDGCDNQWPKAEILKAVEESANGLAAATFVEYGYYADRPMLTQMAEKCGGQLIFSDGFGKFSPILDASIQKQALGGIKVQVEIPEKQTIGNIAYALDNGDLLTFEVKDGKAMIPAHINQYAYLTDDIHQYRIATLVQQMGNKDYVADHVYAAISLFSIRMKPKVVRPLLKVTGDVAFINQFSQCFGKQRYSDFQQATKDATFDNGKRLTEGFDPTLVPPDDAFTLLDFLQIFQMNENNQVLLNHPAFKYNRIGRSRVDANTRLTTEEQEELLELTASMVGLKDVAKIKEVNARIQELTDKPEPLKFVETFNGGDGTLVGYSVNNLVFNQDRPNVSIQVRKEGTVDLFERSKDLDGGAFGPQFETFIFRAYTIIKDGLVNVEDLPVVLDDSTIAAIFKAEQSGKLKPGTVENDGSKQGTILVHLNQLPIINAKMTKEASAVKLFTKNWELIKAQAAQKVFNSFKKLHFPDKESKQFEALYGESRSKWLAEQGITDYSGFAPKVLQAESKDVYMAKVLKVSVKGYSTIPSLKAFLEKRDKVNTAAGTKKPASFNGPELLMIPAVKECEDFLASDIYKKAANQETLLSTWLKDKAKAQTALCRSLLFGIAQIKFSVIVGQVWFVEFGDSLDNNTMDLTLDGVTLNFKAEMLEVEEKI